MSINPSTAQAQGEQRAGFAEGGELTVGLTDNILYNDIENWNTSISACNAAVQAFENGFCFEVRALSGECGFYTSSSAMTQMLPVSNRPHYIFPAYRDGNPRVADEYGLPCGDWYNNQRIKQFSYQATGTVGQTTIKNYDNICADALVVSTSTLANTVDSGPCV